MKDFDGKDLLEAFDKGGEDMLDYLISEAKEPQSWFDEYEVLAFLEYYRKQFEKEKHDRDTANSRV